MSLVRFISFTYHIVQYTFFNMNSKINQRLIKWNAFCDLLRCYLLSPEKEEDFRKALDVSLLMLDYACWKINLVAWKSLKAAIIRLKKQYVMRNVITLAAPQGDSDPIATFGGDEMTTSCL